MSIEIYIFQKSSNICIDLKLGRLQLHLIDADKIQNCFIKQMSPSVQSQSELPKCPGVDTLTLLVCKH